MFKRLISSFICITFSFTNFQYAQAQNFSINQLPVPGTMVGVSAPFAPLSLKGLVVNPQKPLEFQFIVDTGRGPQDATSVKTQANQLVKYFLAGLTIPEGDLWVNLSPYEKNRMVPEFLGQTDLGRDLLAQDYILKQLTASLIYPEKDLGKEFWSRVYAKAQEQFGTTNIPVNTFNKVWILPNQAQVFENKNAAYITKSTLKVMLDEDYLALQKHTAIHRDMASVGANIVRQIILPEIEKEVNTGKNFAPLRQIYQALILVKWYKQTIQNGLLDAVYTNKSRIAGVNLKDPAVKEQIYERYLQAYKKGAFNYIKETPASDGQVVPRKYFSGGTNFGDLKVVEDYNPADVQEPDGAMLSLKVVLAAVGSILNRGLKAKSNSNTIDLFPKKRERKEKKPGRMGRYDGEESEGDQWVWRFFAEPRYLPGRWVGGMLTPETPILGDWFKNENQRKDNAMLGQSEQDQEITEEDLPAMGGSIYKYNGIQFLVHKGIKNSIGPLSHGMGAFFFVKDNGETVSLRAEDILPAIQQGAGFFQAAYGDQVDIYGLGESENGLEMTITTYTPRYGHQNITVDFKKLSEYLKSLFAPSTMASDRAMLGQFERIAQLGTIVGKTAKVRALIRKGNIDEIMLMLNNSDSNIRRIVLTAIDKLMIDPSIKMSIFKKALESRYSNVQLWALQELRASAMKDEETVRLLRVLYKFSPYPEVTQAAADILKELGDKGFQEQSGKSEKSPRPHPAGWKYIVMNNATNEGFWRGPNGEIDENNGKDSAMMSVDEWLVLMREALANPGDEGSEFFSFEQGGKAGVYLNVNFVKAHRNQFAQGVLALSEAEKEYNTLGLGLRDGLSYAALSGMENFHLAQRDALIFMTIGKLLGYWDIDKGQSMSVFVINKYDRNKVIIDSTVNIPENNLPQDAAMVNGGIDLNQINVNHTGKTMSVQFDPAQLNELLQGGFEGFTPVIINITRISSPFQLLGVNASPKASSSAV